MKETKYMDDFIQEQEQRLRILRKKWLEAAYPKEKKFIENQAKLLKFAVEEHKKNMSKDEQLQLDAKEIFNN